MFSGFTLGCLITKKRKKTETVIDHIMQTWVGVGVGSSKKFLAGRICKSKLQYYM